MRPLVIILIFLGAVSIAMLVAGGFLAPSQDLRSSWRDKIETDGPPSWTSVLGFLLSPFSPKVAFEPSRNRCAAPDDKFAPPAGTRYRVAHARLAGGEGAKIIFNGREARMDHKSWPLVLCLKSAASTTPAPADCENASPQPKASLAIGPKGGCVSVQPFGNPPGVVSWE